MPTGPGKYDDLCTFVREQAKVQPPGAAVVIILNGEHGAGFSCQTIGLPPAMLTDALPRMLEKIADEMRAADCKDVT